MSKPVIFARMAAEDVQLIKKICEARGEQLSDFVRRSVRKELARLNYLSSEEKKALEMEADVK
jgi:uncharacterized protein (DUF1778 family)